ncbi:MAG TPA: hypothetical protein PK771_14600, partial [Spirochaetota bacterium]|nr:hypothetical protein [Spirochaetota bacterium]
KDIENDPDKIIYINFDKMALDTKVVEKKIEVKEEVKEVKVEQKEEVISEDVKKDSKKKKSKETTVKENDQSNNDALSFLFPKKKNYSDKDKFKRSLTNVMTFGTSGIIHTIVGGVLLGNGVAAYQQLGRSSWASPFIAFISLTVVGSLVLTSGIIFDLVSLGYIYPTIVYYNKVYGKNKASIKPIIDYDFISQERPITLGVQLKL